MEGDGSMKREPLRSLLDLFLTKTARVLRERKGSLMVEGAIIVPVFLIALLIFAWLIKALYIQESVHAEGTDLAFRLSAQEGIAPGSVKGFYQAGLIQALGELDEKIPSVRVEIGKEEGLFYIDLSYELSLRLPVDMAGPLKISERLLCGSWEGKKGEEKTQGFSQMQQQSDSRSVWVFPRAGERFHKETCRYVKVMSREKLLTDSVRRDYEPCKLCNAAGLKNGAVVYCFESTGKAYHSYDCTSVSRFTIQLSRQEAMEKGYDCCQVCGG